MKSIFYTLSLLWVVALLTGCTPREVVRTMPPAVAPTPAEVTGHTANVAQAPRVVVLPPLEDNHHFFGHRSFYYGPEVTSMVTREVLVQTQRSLAQRYQVVRQVSPHSEYSAEHTVARTAGCDHQNQWVALSCHLTSDSRNTTGVPSLTSVELAGADWLVEVRFGYTLAAQSFTGSHVHHSEWRELRVIVTLQFWQVTPTPGELILGPTYRGEGRASVNSVSSFGTSARRSVRLRSADLPSEAAALALYNAFGRR